MSPKVKTITSRENALARCFRSCMTVNPQLHRRLVSFQANKVQPGYRWFKYKEGFSAELVEYLLDHLDISSGTLLDPFAGSGTALFVASQRGMKSIGIELLPVGKEFIECRKLAHQGDRGRLLTTINRYLAHKPWRNASDVVRFPHLRITTGAFPEQNESDVGRYLWTIGQEPNANVRSILRLAAMCILEEISFTRKDGQYLRWDHRSGRKASFDKGDIRAFDLAIEQKLTQIRDDLRDAPDGIHPGEITVLPGSCLDNLSSLPAAAFDCLITSPPYCNRYDYTRTYALELAYLNVREDQVKALRQEMISCTVENREKQDLVTRFGKDTFLKAKSAFDNQTLLAEILSHLEHQRLTLNNPGIPRMVRGYFLEMALVIFECARVLKPGAPLVMVNDNVRYEGIGIPVDLILSDIAQSAGFDVEKIWVLPVGKGNSSQQMGRHGRSEMRKCIYIWRTRRRCRKAGRKSCLKAASQRRGCVKRLNAER